MPTPRRKSTKPAADRTNIISTVQTPLGFFTLVVLIVEGIFGAVAATSQTSDRTYLIVGMLALIVFLVCIVAAMAVFRPGSLLGAEPAAQTVLSSSGQSPPRVALVEDPDVLCAATAEFEDLGFEQDIAIIQSAFPNAEVEHNVTSASLRRLLTQRKFDVVHLLNLVEPKDGALIFGKHDALTGDGFVSLIGCCAARLVILASCDSIDLAAKVSRKANVIAATAVVTATDFADWAECFYGLLGAGRSLSQAHEIARATTNAPMVLLTKEDLCFSLSDRERKSAPRKGAAG